MQHWQKKGAFLRHIYKHQTALNLLIFEVGTANIITCKNQN